MKKTKLIVAIIIMAIMATTVAVVSCKKDNGNTSTQKGYTIQQPADIRQMEDPRTYMLDFKKKLTESKDNEAFNIDDAAWHLACLANLDFCNVNVECDDFQFDTIEMQVNITDGIILLGDLRTAYEQMCTEIRQFKNGFSHCDQNLYYINVSIGAEGNARIALMTSFNSNSKYLWNHTWYFDSEGDALLAFYEYFSDDSTFQWNTTAANELERALNLVEHHVCSIPGPNGTTVWYYFPTRNHTFDYSNTASDPYNSGFFNESRVFAIRNNANTLNYILSIDEVTYCFDSYLGLGYDYISSYQNECPICWTVTPVEKQNTAPPSWTHYHKLRLEYALPITPNPPGPFID
jgi:hypothetical protein